MGYISPGREKHTLFTVNLVWNFCEALLTTIWAGFLIRKNIEVSSHWKSITNIAFRALKMPVLPLDRQSNYTAFYRGKRCWCGISIHWKLICGEIRGNVLKYSWLLLLSKVIPPRMRIWLWKGLQRKSHGNYLQQIVWGLNAFTSQSVAVVDFLQTPPKRWQLLTLMILISMRWH